MIDANKVRLERDRRIALEIPGGYIPNQMREALDVTINVIVDALNAELAVKPAATAPATHVLAQAERADRERETQREPTNQPKNTDTSNRGGNKPAGNKAP